MTALVEHGHAHNLTVEWYMNGCGCVGPDNHPGSLMNYKGDVAAIRQHGFDGVKFGAPHRPSALLPKIDADALCRRWLRVQTAAGRTRT